jgi:hypothetical protein
VATKPPVEFIVITLAGGVLLLALIVQVVRQFIMWWRAKLIQIVRGAKDDEPRCPHCGYSFQGIDIPRCPECGRAWGFDATFEQLGVDEQSVIAARRAKRVRPGTAAQAPPGPASNGPAKSDDGEADA